MEKIKHSQAYKRMHKSLPSESWELCAARELLLSPAVGAFERGQLSHGRLREARGALMPGPRSRLQLLRQAAAVRYFSKISGESLLPAVTV